MNVPLTALKASSSSFALAAGDGPAIVSFAEGLVGLPHSKRFGLVVPEEIDPLLRMRGLEEPDLCFLLVDPRLVLKDYRPVFPESTLAGLGLSTGSPGITLVVVCLASRPEQCSVNLLAPLLIDPVTMRGLQAVLEPCSYSIRHPLLSSTH